MLIDSNILIYAAHPEFGWLRSFIRDQAPAASIITYIEVVGYHKLLGSERTLLGEVTQEVVVPIVTISSSDPNARCSSCSSGPWS